MERSDHLGAAISAFGEMTRSKLTNLAATGAPEDQLRAPLEMLFQELAALVGNPAGTVDLIGETTLAALSTRPDYAVTNRNELIGFIEIKAPGKGADPRKFTGDHDKTQWRKLKCLPNLLYTDGNAFSVWNDGELCGRIVKLDGDVETSGKSLRAPQELVGLIASFLSWNPVPPRTAKDLAEVAARLCRLLRDEVVEELGRDNASLKALAREWRDLLFPQADDAQFADGYAQAVTFGLLMAKAREISLANGIGHAALELRDANSLIGTALRLLTDDPITQKALETSLGTLVRVLDVIDWKTLSKGRADAWLYFYEDFLAVYDNRLRKRTGSYYTPPQVVDAMVRLVDEALREPHLFGRPMGLADSDVKIGDPAVGTGTYLLGVLRRIAGTIEDDQGPGAVPGAIEAAVKRLIGFEIQFGPFAVAQLRLIAEIQSLMSIEAGSGRKPPAAPPVHHGYARRSLRRSDAILLDAGSDRAIPERRQCDQEGRGDHCRHRKPTIQGKGQGARGLDRVWNLRLGSTAFAMDATSRMGRKRAREAPLQSLCLFLAVGDMEGVWDRVRGLHR